MYDTYNNEIVFCSSIGNWENIKNMSDEFWSEFLAIGTKQNFKFQNFDVPIYDDEKAPEFKSTFKSVNFNLMSAYVSAMLQTEQKRQTIGFGQLEIVWNPDDAIYDIMNDLNIAFKYFYKFNYNLWKVGGIRGRIELTEIKNNCASNKTKSQSPNRPKPSRKKVWRCLTVRKLPCKKSLASSHRAKPSRRKVWCRHSA